MNVTVTPYVNGNKEISHIARIEINSVTIDTDSVFEVPVYVEVHNGQPRFNLEMCGFRVEVYDANRLAAVAEKLMTGLINMSRLPSYVFIARHAGGIYPVYTVDNEVFATTPGGPVFRHVELAKVREFLSDYLHDVGLLGKKGLNDKLHVRGINMKTLGLRRPIFYLKKRVPGQTDFWAPVFESGDGKRIYTFAANARREAPIAGGQEVIFLRELVAQALLTDKRLHDLHDLRPDRLFPAYWERLEMALEPQGSIQVGPMEMPVYSNNYVWIGVEMRPEEARYSLFVGKDASDIQRRALIDFARRGLVANTAVSAY